MIIPRERIFTFLCHYDSYVGTLIWNIYTESSPPLECRKGGKKYHKTWNFIDMGPIEFISHPHSDHKFINFPIIVWLVQRGAEIDLSHQEVLVYFLRTFNSLLIYEGIYWSCPNSRPFNRILSQ